MKKTYAMPLITATDVVRATETGQVTCTKELLTITQSKL
jgi:hypothetical protein